MRRTGLAALMVLALLGTGFADDEKEAPARGVVVPVGKAFMPNPGFEIGAGERPQHWSLYGPDDGMQFAWGDHGIEGSKGIRFTPPETIKGWVKPAGLAYAIRKPEANVQLEVTAWVHLTKFQGQCMLWARCDGKEGKNTHDGAFENSRLAGYTLAGSTIWTPVTVRVTPSDKTTKVVIGLVVGGTGTVRVDEFHARSRTKPVLEQGAAAAKVGPGLYRAKGRYMAHVNRDSETSRVRFPIPILWREQIPLDFRVWTQPPEHLAAVTLHRRAHGHLIAEVEFANMAKGKEIRLGWDAHVLALPHTPSPVPKGISLPLQDVPTEIAPWLQATWCCDWKHADVAAVAADIAKEAPTADVAIEKTLARMRNIFREARGRTTNLTADEALTKRGSCTSCANLGAALLRAQGIPARIVAGFPTWSGPLQTHYVVEYWLPKGGWRLMESTRCQDDRPSYEQIEVALVLPEDEAEAVACRRASVAGGVPHLTLTEYPDAKSPSDMRVHWVGNTRRKACDHEAVHVATFEDGDAKAWAAAAATLRARWQAATKAAREDPTQIKGLAPVDGIAKVKSLDALTKLFGE